MFCGGNIDWSATGSMLSGIGTVLGAVLVLIAALIGRNTFESWKRQQILQKHMALAEQLMLVAYKLRQDIRRVRGIVEPDVDISRKPPVIRDGASSPKLGTEIARRLEAMRPTRDELETVKPLAYVFFGNELHEHVEKLIGLVDELDTAATMLTYDFGNNLGSDFRNTVSITACLGGRDVFGEKVNTLVEQLEGKMSPMLREASGKLTVEEITKALKHPLARAVSNALPSRIF